MDLTKLTPEEKLELIDELWTIIKPEEFPLTESSAPSFTAGLIASTKKAPRASLGTASARR